MTKSPNTTMPASSRRYLSLIDHHRAIAAGGKTAPASPAPAMPKRPPFDIAARRICRPRMPITNGGQS